MAASSMHKTSSRLDASSNITIVRTDPSPTHGADLGATLSSSVNTLFPVSADRGESDADSRYFTASSGDERYFDDDDDDDYNEDDDDDDDGMCIMLDSDDEDADAGSLSGLHINLRTLQAVSNMLAHYTPIIQRDAHGNPVFVPPPPPDCDITPDATPTKVAQASPKTRDFSTTSAEVSEDLQNALQELENVITAEEDTFLVDKMSELTEVMEKMTYYAAEEFDSV